MRPALLVLIVLAAGCLEGGEGGAGAPTPTATPAATPTPASGDVEMRTLAEGQQEGPETPKRETFTDEASWREAAARYGEAAAQDVDLSRETVVAVALGQKPNACWGIEVTGAQESEGRTLVNVTTYEPPVDLFCAQVVTYPFHVVALDGAGREVVFVERNATFATG